MTLRELRLIARNLEGVAMQLETGGEPERQLADEIRCVVSRLRSLSRSSVISFSHNRAVL